MRTVVLGPRPPELEALIQRRRALGQDRFDEVWEGDYHMVPGPHFRHAAVDSELAVLLRTPAQRAGLVPVSSTNVGRAEDFRVPDQLLLRDPADEAYQATAAMVIEILSPDDETFEKFGFYAEHGVEEILVADPAARTVRLWQLTTDPPGYAEVTRSRLLDVRADELRDRISWP